MAGDLYLRAERYASRPTPCTHNEKIDAPLALLIKYSFKKPFLTRSGIERRPRHCLMAMALEFSLRDGVITASYYDRK